MTYKVTMLDRQLVWCDGCGDEVELPDGALPEVEGWTIVEVGVRLDYCPRCAVAP